MGLALRTLFIWLLVLAVTSQGAAAASMAFCGSGHHGGASTLALGGVAAAHDHAQAHDHLQPHQQPHQHAQTPAVPLGGDDANAATEAVAPAQHGHAVTQKCSACAACCAVAAMLHAVLVVPAPSFGPTLFATVVPGVDAFAAEAPDRPPRAVLA